MGASKGNPSSFTLNENGIETNGAICFDYSNPGTIRNLSWKGVDLSINVSNTWASFVTGIAKENKFRGIENGFWSLKCDSGGKVLYASPFGETFYQYGPEINNKAKYTKFDI